MYFCIKKNGQFKITIQNTSSPNILKFESNHFLVKNNYEFNNIDEATNSNLAQQLFYLPFVKKVYISGNFIAIEKFNIAEWEEIQDELAEQIEDYLNSRKSIVSDDVTPKKKPITIYAESTPNPSVMKFVANKKLVETIFEFKSIDDAKISPLASKLFHYPFVKEIFMDENYISITKYDIADWEDITMELREDIGTFISNGNSILDVNAEKPKKEVAPEVNLDLENLDDVSEKIIDVLNEYIKPAVASDGGNIMFQSYDKTTKDVKVILQGACSGCPSSTMTLKNGIETLLKEMIPNKINNVIAING